jgi:hypothetical protein
MPAVHSSMRDTTRATAFALAVLASAIAPSSGEARPAAEAAAAPSQASAESPSASDERDTARARSSMTAGVGLMGASALVGALAVWAWASPDSYGSVRVSDDPGPQIDPTPFFTPAYAMGLAGIGGALVLRGVAMHRGLAPEVPWTYWVGLAPAAVGLGAEVFLFLHDPPSTPANRLIAAGTASTILCFWGSTAWHAARIGDGEAAARAATAERSRSPMLVPLLGSSADGPSVGIAVRGAY